MAEKRQKKRNQIIAFRRKVVLVTVLLVIMCALIVFLLLFLREEEVQSEFAQEDESSVEKDAEDEDTVTMDMKNPVYPLFVGDSRTVGMAATLDEAGVYVDNLAKNGSSYPYLTSLDERIRNSGSDCIVIGFGVNDLNNIEDYTDYANELGKSLAKPVYFLTVNPVDEAKASRNGYYIKNSRILSFNEILKDNARYYTVLDTNSFIDEAGFNTVDGLHYDDETYIKIYEYIMVMISNLQ